MQLIRSERFGVSRNLKQFETTSELRRAIVIATWRGDRSPAI
jgi:hypothetical protein